MCQTDEWNTDVARIGGSWARSPTRMTFLPPNAISLECRRANRFERKVSKDADTMDISSIIIVSILSKEFRC